MQKSGGRKFLRDTRHPGPGPERLSDHSKGRSGSECVIVIASYGLSPDIREPGHEAPRAYFPMSSAVKTRTSPLLLQRYVKN